MRRVARAFLPLATEIAGNGRWNVCNSITIKDGSLSSVVDMAVLHAWHVTNNLNYSGSNPLNSRVPFVIPEVGSTHGVGDRKQARNTVDGSLKKTMSISSAAGSSSVNISMPPLSELRKLNPEMAAVVELHNQEQERSHDVGSLVLQTIQMHVGPLKGGKINKTAVNKLRVNVLRDVLEKIGSDSRGNKAALVARVLDEIRKDEENIRADEVADGLGDTFSGAASRKQIFKLQKAREQPSEAVPQTSHILGHRADQEPVASKFQYERVFGSPDDIAQLLVKANAIDIVMINVMGKCAFTDHMVLASARSHRSVHMLAQAVLHELKQRCKEVAPGIAPSVEGADDPNPEWLVVDAGSVVVHVFHQDHRAEFDLEGLWGNADKTNVVRVATPQKLTLEAIH
jgi:ribosome-associated protein